MRSLRVKFILPALTEATSPYWRPIKYSLFPPLGLATLAAYLRPEDEAVIEDEHVSRVRLNDSPDLVVIQVYITSARRAYAIADHYRRRGAFVVLGGRSEEHTSELQSLRHLVCRLLLEKKKKKNKTFHFIKKKKKKKKK